MPAPGKKIIPGFLLLLTSQGPSNAVGTGTWLLMLTGPEIILAHVRASQVSALKMASFPSLLGSVSVEMWGSSGDTEKRTAFGPGWVEHPCLSLMLQYGC